MNILLQTIEKIVSKLKNDPSYKIRSSYTTKELLYSAFYRAMQLIRGLKVYWKFSKAKSPLFCGKNVVIQYGYQITSGPGLILEDRVHISALSERGIAFGRNVTVAKDSILVCTGVIANKGVGIQIGNHSAVGAQSFLGGQGGIVIGDDVIMGPGVRIFSENHIFSEPTILIRQQGESRRGVRIENNCWIGASVTILDGVCIGEGTVVGAGAVVTSNIPPNCFAVGVPAKVIRERCQI